MVARRNDPNYLGAFLSFLRVFATNLATAWLALEYAAQEGMTWEAAGIGAATALALTVVNFFRSGETRFGPPPNPGAPDGDDGHGDGDLLVKVAVAVVIVLLIVFLVERI